MASSAKRKTCPTRSSQDATDQSDIGDDAEWRKYLKLEADDELADEAAAGGAAARASVIRRDGTGDRAASTSDVATEDRRSTDATGNGDERQRTVSGPRSLSRDSSVWRDSRAETERQIDRNAWLVFCVLDVVVRQRCLRPQLASVAPLADLKGTNPAISLLDPPVPSQYDINSITYVRKRCL